jgi:nitroimidazol reductase NimA-like FMN-containing flavoprotein (pyridoxamine 5'-phosphate oxidase superfamily)
MENSPHTLRRKDRAISENETIEILSKGEYGILSTVSADGQPYGVPVSYCLVENALYFHCAVEGHKLNNLQANPRVSFCVVGKTEVQPDKFGTKYESAIVFGQANEVSGEEKQIGLEGLLKKYSTDFFPEGLEYIKRLTERTRVYKITIATITGKAKR